MLKQAYCMWGSQIHKQQMYQKSQIHFYVWRSTFRKFYSTWIWPWWTHPGVKFRGAGCTDGDVTRCRTSVFHELILSHNFCVLVRYSVVVVLLTIDVLLFSVVLWPTSCLSHITIDLALTLCTDVYNEGFSIEPLDNYSLIVTSPAVNDLKYTYLTTCSISWRLRLFSIILFPYNFMVTITWLVY